ncbi:MAG TPA: hypothetical protein VNE16_03760 [Vicinamibacterales bacterium]|nr:hypothetical protein [Vicinamibacterales bacterium]
MEKDRRRKSPWIALGLALAVGLCWSQRGVFVHAQSATSGGTYDLSRMTALKWRNIGPNRGGRSIAVAGSAARPDEYFFGAVGGGLWQTRNGGITWNPVTDHQIKSSSVGAVAVAPSNPDIIYIGMGESALRGNIMTGDGIYKSVNDGKTWTHMGLADTETISRICVDPTDPNLVYVAALGHPWKPNTERGVFRSTDGGKTWKKILYRDDKTGAVDLVIDPNHPKVLYAALWEAWRNSWGMSSGGPGSGLFKSTDGGDHWTEITRNPGMPSGIIGRIGITVSGADSNRLYAVVENAEGGVFRSDDAGATWKRVNDEDKIRQRSFYFSEVFADPKNVNEVYALNTSLFRSMDGGKTFTAIQQPHGDNHDLWIDPKNPARMINGNDGGGTVTTDGGKTWSRENFPTAQIYHVGVTTDFPYWVCGAQQDNSTVCLPSSDTANIRTAGTPLGDYYIDVGGGESGYVTPDPSDPNIIYAGDQGAALTRFNRKTGEARDVQPYPRFFSGEPSNVLPERWQWTFPIVFDPLNPKILYTSSQHLWKTTNGGQSWEKISPDLTRHDPKTLGDSGGPITHDMNGPEIYATIFTIAPSRKEEGTIWTGSDDGLIYITRDGGQHWENITPKDMPPFARISMIDASPFKAGTAYVAAKCYQMDDYAPYIFRTDDYGKTWTKIVTGIAPDDYVHVVREDPAREGLLYAGTEHGVYVSFDDGARWQSLSLNLPDTQVADMIVQPNDLVIATHGRSFYILDDIWPLRQLTPAVMSSTVHLFKPEVAYRRIVPASIDYYLSRPVGKVTLDILNAQGQVIRHVVGTPALTREAAKETGFRRPPPPPTTHAGLNRYEWNLRLAGATSFPGLILWGANFHVGPYVVPGDYQVRITADGVTQTQPLTVKMNPNVHGITQTDLEQQYTFAGQIQAQVSRADEGVIEVRRIRSEIVDRVKKAHLAGVTSAGDTLARKLTAVEEDLYQVKNRSNEDPLNFAIKINNRLAALERIVESADARPTDQSYTIFKQETATLDGYMSTLHSLLGTDLPAFNKLLAAHGLAPVAAKP